MKLKSKMVIVLVAIMVILTIAYYGVFRLIILKSFSNLDQRIAMRNMDRCVAALDREVKHLESFNSDWSNWDDSYQFALDGNKAYITANLIAETFKNQKLNLMHVYDSHGRLVWGKTYDLQTGKEIPLDLSVELGSNVFHTIVNQKNPDKSISGFILTRYGILFISSNPILDSNNKGPSHGAYVMGRLFNQEMRSILSEQVSVKLDAWSLGDPNLPKGLGTIVKALNKGTPVKLIEATPGEMHAYSLLRDIEGKSISILKASMPREIMIEGRWTYNLGMAFIIAVGFIILISVSVLMSLIILKPLSKLTETVLTVGSKEGAIDFDTKRSDELGTLAREFSVLIERLHERQRSLEFGEKRLRQIIDLVPHYIYARDKEGRFILVNKAVAGFFDTAIKALIGRNDVAFVRSPDEIRTMHEKDLAVLDSGQPRNIGIEKIMDAHGHTRFVQTNKIPLLSWDESTPAVLSVSVDITGTKMAEDALRESERRLSDIIDFLPDATFAIDRQGRIIAWNRAMEDMSGVSKIDIMSQGRYEYAIPFYGQARPALADLILEDNKEIEKKYDYVVKDSDKLISETFAPYLYGGKGAYIWVVAAPLYDSNGNVTGAIESIRDITERKKAEEILQRHSETIEQSLDGIVMADLEGKILYINRAWAMMHGYTADEVIGMHINVFHTQEQLENWVIPFNNKSLEKGSHRDNLWHVKKDGTSFPTLMSAFMLKNKKGDPVAVIGIARDITEELKMENQLLQAQKMEVVGRLAGGIAHDLNNMLSPILGYAEIILAGMHENNPLFDNLSQIKKAAENARTLTQELLAFSRKQVLEMKVVDLAEVVASYGKMLRRTIREDIAIQIRQNVSKGAVRVDVGQMGQILMNLAVNAQDAMSQGGTIIIEINDVIVDGTHTLPSQDMLPGEYVTMTFSDTGSGMNVKIMENIFEPFFTTKERGKGTGLGLATVYGIVKQHGGHIVVYSEIGIGTTFKIYLPRVEGIPENLVTSKVITKIKEGTETVVIAEDNDAVRELAFDILTMSGYNVLTASNTDELLHSIQEYDGSIDLLLTDVIMPGLNGPELYERLKGSYPVLKVIYMSGYTDDVIAHHGILEQGVDFIQKPFSVNILTDKLRKVLDS